MKVLRLLKVARAKLQLKQKCVFIVIYGVEND